MTIIKTNTVCLGVIIPEEKLRPLLDALRESQKPWISRFLTQISCRSSAGERGGTFNLDDARTLDGLLQNIFQASKFSDRFVYDISGLQGGSRDAGGFSLAIINRGKYQNGEHASSGFVENQNRVDQISPGESVGSMTFAILEDDVPRPTLVDGPSKTAKRKLSETLHLSDAGISVNERWIRKFEITEEPHHQARRRGMTIPESGSPIENIG